MLYYFNNKTSTQCCHHHYRHDTFSPAKAENITAQMILWPLWSYEFCRSSVEFRPLGYFSYGLPLEQKNGATQILMDRIPIP
jgi:hypothetical protein